MYTKYNPDLLDRLLRNDPSISGLYFCHDKNITDIEVDKICDGLQNNSNVKSLLLNATNITDHSVGTVAKLLRVNPYLKRIELARNQKINDGSLQNFYKEFKDRFNKKEGFFNRMSLNPHRSMQNLDEVHNLKPEQFISDFFLPQIPVVIKGAARSSPAVQKWSPSFFVQKIPNSKIKLNIYDYTTVIQKHLQFVSINLKMSQAIDLIESNLDDLITRYYSQQLLLDDFPEINGDITLPVFASRIKYSKLSQHLWIGQRDTHSHLHFDNADNVFLQVFGIKVVVIYPPSDTKYLFQNHPIPYTLSSGEHYSTNISNIDDLNFDCQIFNQAKPLQVLLEEGDALFIPKGYWHDVRSLTTSISVNYWFDNDFVLVPEIENNIKTKFFGKKQQKSTILQSTKALIDNDIPNYTYECKKNALQVAVIFDVAEAVKLLLDHPSIVLDNTNIIQSYDYPFTPFFLSIAFGFLDIVNLFISHHDIDLNKEFEESGHTPLTLAIEKGHVLVVNCLLEAGVDLYKKDLHGRSPLELAIQGHNYCCAIELLKKINKL